HRRLRNIRRIFSAKQRIEECLIYKIHKSLIILKQTIYYNLIILYRLLQIFHPFNTLDHFLIIPDLSPIRPGDFTLWKLFLCEASQCPCFCIISHMRYGIICYGNFRKIVVALEQSKQENTPSKRRHKQLPVLLYCCKKRRKENGACP